MAQTKRFIFIILPSLLYTFVSAQGYGDAPDPEPPKVTTAPILIDCNPPVPKAIEFPTLPPPQLIEFPTLPPAPKLPTIEEIFGTTASYQTAPPPTTTEGYNVAPPQLPTLAPPPKLPTFNELFPPVAPATTQEPYAQPKIDYIPAPVAPSAPSYQTAPPMFTFAPPPPPPKLPTFAELFPPIPVAPVTVNKPQGSYQTGPPSVQPQDPYSTNDNDDDMDGDDTLLQPAEPVENDEGQEPKIEANKARAKLEKLRRMHGVKNKKMIVGSPHHLHMHNYQELHKFHH